MTILKSGIRATSTERQDVIVHNDFGYHSSTLLTLVHLAEVLKAKNLDAARNEVDKHTYRFYKKQSFKTQYDILMREMFVPANGPSEFQVERDSLEAILRDIESNGDVLDAHVTTANQIADKLNGTKKADGSAPLQIKLLLDFAEWKKLGEATTSVNGSEVFVNHRALPIATCSIKDPLLPNASEVSAIKSVDRAAALSKLVGYSEYSNQILVYEKASPPLWGMIKVSE